MAFPDYTGALIGSGMLHPAPGTHVVRMDDRVTGVATFWLVRDDD